MTKTEPDREPFFSTLLAVHGKRQLELGSAGRRIGQHDGASVGSNNRSNNRQAKSRSASGTSPIGMDTGEPLENCVTIFGRNTWPIVGDNKGRHGTSFNHGKRDALSCKSFGIL